MVTCAFLANQNVPFCSILLPLQDLKLQPVRYIPTLVFTKHAILIKTNWPLHWGIAIQIIYKLQLLLYKIGFCVKNCNVFWTLMCPFVRFCPPLRGK